MIKQCIFCCGTGTVCKDVGDNNDVLLKCDDCRGTGIDLDVATDEEKAEAFKAMIKKQTP